jgi:adenine-specific DNA-methyltransferase
MSGAVPCDLAIGRASDTGGSPVEPVSARLRARQGNLACDLYVASEYDETALVALYHGDCADLLAQIPRGSVQLVVTSPPYNIGKEYETRKGLDAYIEDQRRTISRCVELLTDSGSICWQVGNHVQNGQIWPLDVLLYEAFAAHGLKLRNRIVWYFGHGLHCKRRFSGRYETINWFTKSDDYVFNLDAVRVPQKYPGKRHFKGPKAGEYSCDPLGKNPTDVWEIPNVKANHIEKTIHPCQFPVELVERLVLALSNKGDLVLDPYIGVGSTAVAALMHGRRAAGAEIREDYIEIARERVHLAASGRLRTRPMTRPVYEPRPGGRLTRSPFADDQQ